MIKPLRLFTFILLWTVAESVSAQTITDILNYNSVGISGKYYKSWKNTLSSGATYQGNSAGGKNTIQLRSSNKSSGIVVTKSGGTVKSVTIRLYSTNVDTRQVDVYGKNTPYTQIGELYTVEQGELIGSITPKTTEITISPDKNYAFIGIRSKTGLIYVDQIEIEWTKSDFAMSSPKIQGNTPFESSTTISITGDEDSEIYYTLNGENPSISSTKYTEPFIINQSSTIKAIAVKDGLTSVISTATFEKISEQDTDTNPDIAEKGSLSNPYSVTDVINGQCNNKQGVYVEGYICGAYDFKKEINNNVDANIIIGATVDATNYIAVELPKGYLRDAINVSTGGMIETKVILKGNIETLYFGSPGLKATSEAYVGINLTKVRYATMFFSKATLQVPENIKAFTYKMVNDKLAQSKRIAAGENIAAGTAVVLNGEPGDYWCKVVGPNENSVTDTYNILRGTDTTFALSEDTDCYFYILSVNAANDPNSVGFYWKKNYGAAFTNGAHKAYLKVPKSVINANAKSIYLFSDISTAIQPTTYSASKGNPQIHNIAGQRVNRNYKGIIIINGRKYISK